MVDHFEILKLRVAIGFLGEDAQFGWWNSSFFSATASSFLTPVFPRTQFLSQAEGVRAAAAKLHDERIGVGQVFHLFRLTEELEQSLHQMLHDQDHCQNLGTLIQSKDAAMKFLQENYSGSKQKSLGPIMVGDIADIISKPTVEAVGKEYLRGFEAESPVFPFLKQS